uniref:Uncharacterized protein isoform X2 n=1 Tax=Nicotiana tabacum TaxID=4097 RepID=A0A1S3X0T8_TOBAC|nr:uncharacterized protein LOC104087999 isoform X2 [Nicotiana tomentosiformis]XP_016433532.1 PREDICTED: uncharacterized protein LOC107760027 isoform X2 [Nicotiana tabacum]
MAIAVATQPHQLKICGIPFGAINFFSISNLRFIGELEVCVEVVQYVQYLQETAHKYKALYQPWGTWSLQNLCHGGSSR